jgi:tyrosine-protein phosphatase SIW14
VVPFLGNYFPCNDFRELSARATLAESHSNMKRILLIVSLVFVSVLAARLSAQKQVQPSTPSEMHSAYGEKLHIAGVPNSGKINEHLYRGAQPRDPGLLELKKLGITTIVNLRGEDPEKFGWEEKRTESLGIRFVHIPVDGWSPPTNEQVAQFLSIFRDNPQEKVFVHCRFGDDRTGVFVASYRMAFEKFPADQALKEMYQFGFNGAWHRSMADFVRNFPASLNAAPALVPFKSKD